MRRAAAVLLLVSLALAGCATASRVDHRSASRQLPEPNRLTAASITSLHYDGPQDLSLPLIALPTTARPSTTHAARIAPRARSRRTLLEHSPHHKHAGLVYFGFPVAALADVPLNAASVAAHARVALTCKSTANVLALLKYAVSCGLPSSKNVTVTVPWTSGTKTIALQGSMGLAPGWGDAPLDERQQRSITACLAARTNLLSERVEVSLRITGLYPADGPAEDADFPVLEGAFWGNMFSKADARVYSCSGADAVTPRLSKRFCAHGRLPYSRRQHEGEAGPTARGELLEYCGHIRPLGPCDEVCGPLAADGGYRECQGQTEVMTVYLHALPAKGEGSQ